MSEFWQHVGFLAVFIMLGVTAMLIASIPVYLFIGWITKPRKGTPHD